MQSSTLRKFPHRKSLAGAILSTLAILGGSHTALAQARSTASKSADISVFGGYMYSNPDYGPTDNLKGITAGADYTRYFGWRVAPSFEVRASYDTGDLITQKTVLGGLRLQTDFRRYHPYGDALFGGTRIDFKIAPNIADPFYTQDNAFTTSFGGGVDIDVIRSFQAKIDFQSESTNYGPNGTVPGNADFKLTPTKVTFGVVYRIPFGKRHPQ